MPKYEVHIRNIAAKEIADALVDTLGGPDAEAAGIEVVVLEVKEQTDGS